MLHSHSFPSACSEAPRLYELFTKEHFEKRGFSTLISLKDPSVTPGLPVSCQRSPINEGQDFYNLVLLSYSKCVESIAAFLSELQLLMQPEAFPVSVMVLAKGLTDGSKQQSCFWHQMNVLENPRTLYSRWRTALQCQLKSTNVS